MTNHNDHPILPAEQVTKLVLEAQAGNQNSLNQIVIHHQRLVASIAHSYAEKGGNVLNKDDLMQEGYLGLLRAVTLFDPAKGCAFSTYAYRRVRAAMGDFGKAAPIIRGPLQGTARRKFIEETGKSYVPVSPIAVGDDPFESGEVLIGGSTTPNMEECIDAKRAIESGALELASVPEDKGEGNNAPVLSRTMKNSTHLSALINALDKDPSLSQTALAHKLGVSQALISSLFTRYGIARRCRSCGKVRVPASHSCANPDLAIHFIDSSGGELLGTWETAAGQVNVTDLGAGERPIVVSCGTYETHLSRAEAATVSSLLEAIPGIEPLTKALNNG